MKRVLNIYTFVLLIFVCFGVGRADDARTSLIIDGGGLHPGNVALFKTLIGLATVNGRTHIGIIPTASEKRISAHRFVESLQAFGVRPEQIQVLELSEANAATQADSPELVAQIRNCTLIFFTGGDQTRITRALKPNGRTTAALQAIYDVWKDGGVIAGTSAGAAIQSAKMISVSGLPSESMDDGMDALDFGLTRSMNKPAIRGLLVSHGLGFLDNGIIDQHFSQYRGRLGRLARATIEERMRYGFGIDEDASIAVATDGTINVLGPGCLTIVDTAGASCKDGPLGCSIAGVHLACLQRGDSFNPKTGVISVEPDRKLIEAGKESNNGNYVIPDIAGIGAVLQAMISGLGENTSRKQIGITLKHNHHYGHGYRYTFSKTEKTRAYEETNDGRGTVTDVRLDIEPVSLALRSPETALPLDLPVGTSRKALEAISFRGIMLADEQGLFRPNDPITKGEFACAIAQSIRLEPARKNPPVITDVIASSPDADAITLVVAAGLMQTERGFFEPTKSISREEAALVLVRFYERYRSEVLAETVVELKDIYSISPQRRGPIFAAYNAGLLKANENCIRPSTNLTRAEAAEALYTTFRFPWKD